MIINMRVKDCMGDSFEFVNIDKIPDFILYSVLL